MPAGQPAARPVTLAGRPRRNSRGVVFGLLTLLAIGVVGLGIGNLLFGSAEMRPYTDPNGFYQLSVPIGWSMGSPSHMDADTLAQHSTDWIGNGSFFTIMYGPVGPGDQPDLKQVDGNAMASAAMHYGDGTGNSTGGFASAPSSRTVRIGGAVWVEEQVGTQGNGSRVGELWAASTVHAGTLVTILYGTDMAGASFDSAQRSYFQPMLNSFQFRQ